MTTQNYREIDLQREVIYYRRELPRVIIIQNNENFDKVLHQLSTNPVEYEFPRNVCDAMKTAKEKLHRFVETADDPKQLIDNEEVRLF